MMKFIFMTTLYNIINTARLEDLVYCLLRNSKNPMFEKMVFLYDTSKDNGESSLRKIAQEIKHGMLIEIKDRPTYMNFFSFANSNFPGKNILVCNSDIYYDDSLSLINEKHLEKTMIALSRWTHTDKEAYFEFKYPNGELQLTSSADTWIFKSPLPFFKSDFRLGVGHCDTQLAKEARGSGLRVLNPCKSIKTYHLHSVGFKNDEREEKFFYPNPGNQETPATEI